MRNLHESSRAKTNSEIPCTIHLGSSLMALGLAAAGAAAQLQYQVAQILPLARELKCKETYHIHSGPILLGCKSTLMWWQNSWDINLNKPACHVANLISEKCLHSPLHFEVSWLLVWLQLFNCPNVRPPKPQAHQVIQASDFTGGRTATHAMHVVYSKHNEQAQMSKNDAGVVHVRGQNHIKAVWFLKPIIGLQVSSRRNLNWPQSNSRSHQPWLGWLNNYTWKQKESTSQFQAACFQQQKH